MKNEEYTTNMIKTEASNFAVAQENTEKLQQLIQGENLTGQELSTLDNEMMATLTSVGSERKSPVAGSVLHITMATKNPIKVQNLITTNYSKNPRSGIRLKQVKQFRRNMAVKNFGTGQYVFDPALNHTQIAPDPLASSLATLLVGQTGNEESTVIAKEKFVRYITAVLANKDEYQAARLYAAHHFNDPSIFERFPDLTRDAMEAYNRFAGLVKDSAVK
jgi:hypothetical protein